MCKSLFVASILCGLSSIAGADMAIEIPAPTTTLSTKSQAGADETSSGAVQIKELSGATYYIGSASTGQLSETTEGELSLAYSLKYDAADGDYGTAVGILLPLDPEWNVGDLTAMTSITFQAKMAKTGAKIHLIIGSDSYPADMLKENSALTSNDVAVGTSYTTITVLPAELLTPVWAKAPGAGSTGWIADGTTYTTGIAPTVKNLNFQPVLAWTSATVLKADAASANTLSIKNVVVKGVADGGLKPPSGTSCTGTPFVLDAFQSTGREPGGPNALGGSWYAFTDTSSNPLRNDTDSAVGRSRVVLPAGTDAWSWVPGMGAFVTAALEKNDTGSAFLYHKYAGWASIGTNLSGPDGRVPALFQGDNVLTAISFDLYAGASAVPAVPGAGFDTGLVKRITFKVGAEGVPEAAAFQVDIPSGAAVRGWQNQNDGLTSLCVDVTNLKQPAWYVKNVLQGAAAPIDQTRLTKLVWEAKITDQRDPTKHQAQVTFGVGNVQFWGVDATGLRGGRDRAANLRVQAGERLTLSYTVPGKAARIEVIGLDGSRRGTFEGPARADGLALPLRLERGSYLVLVAGEGRRLIQSLAVTR